MAKLDVVATVKEAYSGAWSHFGEMVKLVWVPVLLYVGGMIAVTSFLLSKLEQLPSDATPEQMEQQVQSMMAAFFGWPLFVVILLSLFVWPIIAVAWHRFILTGEVVRSPIYFRFGQREARFLLISVFLSLLQLPYWIVSTLADSMDAGSGAASALGVVSLVLYFAGVFFFVRLTLLLPAVAIDRPIDVQRILEVTEGNFWRLVAVLLLSALGYVAILFVLSIVAGFVSLITGLTFLIEPVISAVTIAGFMIIYVAVISIAYRDLTGGPAASVNPASGPELH